MWAERLDEHVKSKSQDLIRFSRDSSHSSQKIEDIGMHSVILDMAMSYLASGTLSVPHQAECHGGETDNCFASDLRKCRRNNPSQRPPYNSGILLKAWPIDFPEKGVKWHLRPERVIRWLPTVLCIHNEHLHLKKFAL